MNSDYTIILFIASLISIVVGMMVWNRKGSIGAMPLVILMASTFIWSFFQVLSVLSGNLESKVFFANVRYTGVELAPIAFYALAREYNDGKQIKTSKWLKFILVPIIAEIALWTNGYHYRFYTQVLIKNKLLILNPGVLFWINMIYLYVFVLLGVYILMKICFKTTEIYKAQAIILALSAFFPTVANLLFNFNILSLGDIDITPITFIITGVLFFFALFKLKLLDIVPIARGRIIEELEELVIVLDKNKRVLDMNKIARDTILTEGKAYIGKNISEVIENWDALAAIILNTSDGCARISYDKEHYEFRISDIFDEKNKKTGEVVILRNITELQNALMAAKSASKAKGDFLANMSHEIRTPLNAVIGVAEILDTMILSRESQKQYIGMIVRSAEDLLTMINDILDYSKIEAGRMELEKNSFDIRKLVGEIVETYTALAENKLIKLESVMDSSFNVKLIGDRIRVRQIIINLISNAIKFTKEGKVEISIKQKNIENDKVTIVISVSDTGIGVAKEKLGSIFESFKQADNSTTRKFGGTGLGLSIVKNLVELMSGEIMLESELGKGSTFSCHIPFDFEAEKEIVEIKENLVDKKEYKELLDLKVLVAEDNKINRQIINTYLEKLACRVDFAENGQIAVDKFRPDLYDVILMDVQMPELDGIEATKAIRLKEKEMGGHIPIIALTAGVMKEDIDMCLEAGMDSHLSKPIRIEKLYNALKVFAM